MIEVYLLSIFSILLTEYGFQTRKRAMERFGAKVRWRRVITRLSIWGIFFAIWMIKVKRAWRWILILSLLGFITGELTAFITRRAIRADIRSRYPLSRPQSHLIPLFAGFIPALLFAFLLSRTALSSVSTPILSIPVLKFVTGFLGMFSWGTMITVSLIGLVRPDQIADKVEPHLGAGEVIGILERLLSFILVLSGGLAVVGFTVAAKAAARYPQFKDSAFAEYFLIGTLSSVGLATVVALIVALP
jgi:hypothetical protein